MSEVPGKGHSEEADDPAVGWELALECIQETVQDPATRERLVARLVERARKMQEPSGSCTHRAERQVLTIRGKRIADHEMHRYALRWYGEGLPVLYQDGKRVTRPWMLSLDVGVAEDPTGGSANTAD